MSLEHSYENIRFTKIYENNKNIIKNNLNLKIQNKYLKSERKIIKQI